MAVALRAGKIQVNVCNRELATHVITFKSAKPTTAVTSEHIVIIQFKQLLFWLHCAKDNI